MNLYIPHMTIANRNVGQSKCIWCGSLVRSFVGCLPEEQKLELARYAIRNGRSWRSKLREEWLREADTLRYIRNAVGPRRLDHIKTAMLKRYLLRMGEAS